MANQGHAKVAFFMSHHQEFAIFRRFSKLNIQNLLYLQAELIHLEKELREVADRDRADPSRAAYVRDWNYLAYGTDDDEKGQWNAVLQIREKLKEYNDHLQQQVFLSSLRPPKTHDLEFFRSWFTRPKMGNFPITGADHDTWKNPATEHDLVALLRRPSSDPVSRFLSKRVIPCLHNALFHRFKAPIAEDPASEICHYPDRKIVRAMDVLSIVIASMLPIASIVILYFVEQAIDRLIIAVAFTGLFALCLAVTTRARRVEVFTATSAFAAVQVVFVTNNVLT